MSNLDQRRLAKNHYFLFTMVFIIAELLFAYEVGIIGEAGLIGVGFKTIFFLVFIGLTMIGYKWAKLVTLILLILYAVFCLLLGFDTDSLLLKIIAMYYLYFGLVPYLSKRLQFLTLQNGETADKKPLQFVEPEPIIVDGVEHDFPQILKRYQSMLIDGLLILAAVTVFVQVKEEIGLESTGISIVFFIMTISYEPILTAYSATVGQRLMKIRVRDIKNPDQKINLFRAYIRILTKGIFGWLSFLTINFNRERRAIHDLAAASVVVKV